MTSPLSTVVAPTCMNDSTPDAVEQLFRDAQALPSADDPVGIYEELESSKRR